MTEKEIKMNFDLTKEQEAFRAEMEKFSLEKVAPGARERDENEDSEPIYKLLMGEMAERGLLGLAMPKKYGGQGLSYIDFASAMIEFCRKDVSVGAAYSLTLSMGTVPMLNWGSEEIKEKYLRPSLEGKKLAGSFGLTEENAGSDAAMQETTAVLDGNEYVINGKKIYITNAGYSDTYVVIAMTDKSKGTKGGISAFVVEKGTPGFEFGIEYKKMGIRATVQRELIFTDCRIPKGNRLGQEGDGFKIAMECLDYGRLGVAAQGLGCALGAMDLAVKHANEREQFGKTIGKNQAIGFMLADMATDIEMARLLIYKTAWKISEGQPFAKEAAMAKKVATDVGMSVSTNAVQILGGKGFLRENEAERFMRDAKILQIYEGTNQIQNLILSGYVLRGDY